MLIFFILSLINVLLNTLKGLWLAKSNSKFLNCSINAVTFGFYTVVLKQLNAVDIVTSVIVTIITNIIGVYIAMYLNDIIFKTVTKLKIYNITATQKNSNIIIDVLNKYNIGYTDNKVKYKNDILHQIIIFGYNKTENNIIDNILKEYKIKYYTINQ